jgi:hypothetical protein
LASLDLRVTSLKNFLELSLSAVKLVARAAYSLISSLVVFAAAATRYLWPSSLSESSSSEPSPNVKAKFSRAVKRAHPGGGSAMLIHISQHSSYVCKYTYSVYAFSTYGSREFGFLKSWTRFPRWRCLTSSPSLYVTYVTLGMLGCSLD